MTSRHHCIVGALLALILVTYPSHSATDTSASTDKVAVVDGHVVHDLGRIHNHATNWGLIGSWSGAGTTFSHAPSARWPGADGVDHLFAAGLWVGAVVNGQQLVTTSGYQNEMAPTADPGDSIQTAYRGMPGGARYPWPTADDDGDGLEDEDPLNNRDDDGDGLVDEDCAAIGDQHFFATMADTGAALQEAHPDHDPLGIEVLQQSFQWTDPQLADVIGYDFTITNIGENVLEDVNCGLFSDFDIDEMNQDLAGSFHGLILVSDGSYVPVDMAYMVDAVHPTDGGWIGWVMLGIEKDPTANDPDDSDQARGFRIFTGNAPFAQGGDPTNDTERYQALASDQWDNDANLPDDHRVLLTAGPVARLDPGESVTVRWALAVGVDRDAMLLAAGEAAWTAWGRSFDRDGDPGNGEEFVVRWLSPQDQTVPVTTPRLRAGAADGGVRLRCELRGEDGGLLAVERRSAAGVPWRRWPVWDGRSELVDADPVGWPRTYDLLRTGVDGVEKLIDTVEVAGVPAAGPWLTAGPNPFNPRLNISYHLPQAGNARLTVHSLRGDLVRALHDGYVAAGEGSATWNGDDQGGRAQASGVYLVRLATPQLVVEQRVTLVR